MICPNCRKEVPEGSAFCFSCGTKMDVSDASTASASEAILSEPEQIDVFAGPTLAESSPFVTSPQKSEDDVIEGIAPAQELGFSAKEVTESGVESSIPTAPSAAIPAAPAAVGPVGTPVAPVQTLKTSVPPTPPVVLPKSARPITTGGTFWFFFVTCIPLVGLIVLLAVGFGSKNKSRRSVARAILIYQILAVLLICLAFVVLFFGNRLLLERLFDPDSWRQIGQAVTAAFS